MINKPKKTLYLGGGGFFRAGVGWPVINVCFMELVGWLVDCGQQPTWTVWINDC